MDLLYITGAFAGPGRERLSGGLISNLRMLMALRSSMRVRVLSYDRLVRAGEYRHEGLEVLSHPVQRASRLPRMTHRTHAATGTVLRGWIARTGAPDVVMASTSTIPMLLDPTLAGARKVIVARAYEDLGFRAPLPSLGLRLKSGVRRLMNPGVAAGYRAADLVIVNSDHLGQVIRRSFEVGRVEVRSPCLDLPLRPVRLREAPEAVGFVTRGDFKNIDFVAQLASRLPDVRFLIYGNSDGLRLPDNVEPRGWCSDRATMFASARCWIVPSRWPEPFGRVAAEAIACGRPALVADRGGLPEAVGGLADLRLPDLGIEPWAQRIRWALTGAPEVEVVVRAAQVAVSRFGPQHHDSRARALMASLGSRPTRTGAA